MHRRGGESSEPDTCGLASPAAAMLFTASKVRIRGRRQAGFEGLHVGLREHLGDADLRVGGEDHPGLLLAVAHGDVVHRQLGSKRLAAATCLSWFRGW